MGIEIKQVSKCFGETLALDNVSLNLGNNKIYGLLGNNGAGKSTLLNLVTNRLYPTSGAITVDGEAVADNDGALGKMILMGEQDLYPEDTRVRKAFKLSSQLYPDFDLDYALGLAQRFGLDLRAKIKALSTGYSTIARVIVALAANTPYLMLDEPVLGLDAQHRDMLYKEIIELYADKPRTIVISTHLIAEVANLIEHTIVIDRGQIIRNSPTEELLAGVQSVAGPRDVVATATTGCAILSRQAIGGLEVVYVEKREGFRQLAGEGLPSGVEVTPVNLQDYFIALMQMRELKAASKHPVTGIEEVVR